ncbi:hypothetical protein DS742_19280 [Lacrimispora amygdalina]|uniref:Uncharacterized protein n=1 Tax=Lacrimispora amygdalina TaxID=253257 RepID=A0A3E2N8J4_9FIRM|nr:hypothetical protein [Clostridium indicum]RFZ77333.1 hypothetical protein DS742_19280 [Clostridium indicum]
MAFKTLYAVYDKGKLLGEHTTKEWGDLLTIPRQAIRDYAREGRTYGKRYAFEMVGTVASDGIETEPEDPGITMRDLAEFKQSVKVGDKFTYKSYRKDFVRGVQIELEKMIVVRKFSHLVQVASLADPSKTATMTYAELYKQKKNRAKKKLTAGR